MCKLDLSTRICEAQNNDGTYLQVNEKLQQGKVDEKCEGYQLGEDDIIVYKGKFCFPNCTNLKKVILDEIYQIPYFGHPGYQNTITTKMK